MLVRIYRPAKNAMQSGRANVGIWIADFEPASPKRVDPLMGWVGSPDTRGQVKLKFKTKEEAVAWAKREGHNFQIFEAAPAPTLRPKSYADKFRYDRIA
ncbi:MAG: ETC complex I subunit [Rhodospirillales bacterium]|nr:ETC complex I subunit [Rhodospirillales bacterium]